MPTQLPTISVDFSSLTYSHDNELVYLNQVLNTRQDEDVVNGYNESECVSAGFSPVSLDFNPIRVDDKLIIVRNDAHFKELLDNTLKDLGVINA